MRQLYRRKPDLVWAERWYPGRKVMGVERHAFAPSKHQVPAVLTVGGWVRMAPGLWVLIDANGDKNVLNDEWFQVGYEPVEG
jgi:hypothetical protein